MTPSVRCLSNRWPTTALGSASRRAAQGIAGLRHQHRWSRACIPRPFDRGCGADLGAVPSPSQAGTGGFAIAADRSRRDSGGDRRAQSRRYRDSYVMDLIVRVEDNNASSKTSATFTVCLLPVSRRTRPHMNQSRHLMPSERCLALGYLDRPPARSGPIGRPQECPRQ